MGAYCGFTLSHIFDKIPDIYKHSSIYYRHISVIDVVITPMSPYRPIPFHILSFAIYSSPEF